MAPIKLADLHHVFINEATPKRDHESMTLFVDIDRRRMTFIADGRHASAVRPFADRVSETSRIKDVRVDMSRSFIKGVKITFVKFRLITTITSMPALKSS